MQLICSFLLHYILAIYLFPFTESAKTVYCDGEVDKWTHEIHFKSPNYPSPEKNQQTICKLKMDLSSHDAIIRVEFVDVKMDGQVLTGDALGTSGCDSDMFLFRGFDGWAPPPRCGDLKGYSFVIYQMPFEAIDSLQIIAIMSSRKHFWHLKITKLKKPLKEIRDQSCRKKRFRKQENRLELVHSGIPAKISQVPWQASIRYKSPKFGVKPNYSNIYSEGQHFCGGVIVGERYILTAAHCFYGKSKFVPMKNLTDLKVVVGDSRVDTDDLDQERPAHYDIESIAIHYGYDPYIPVHDVAVIILKKKIKFKSGLIEMIQLGLLHGFINTLLESNSTYRPKEGWISGFGSWGNKENGYNKSSLFEDKSRSFPFQLQIGKVNLTNQCRCLQLDKQIYNQFTMCDVIRQWKYVDIYNDICSSSNYSDQGVARIGKEDSGGPLFVYKENKKGQKYPVLYGLILNTKEKNKVFFSTYLSISHHNEWIASVILSYGDTCDSGVRKMGLLSSNYKRLGFILRKAVSFFSKYVVERFCGYWVRAALDAMNNTESDCGYDWSHAKQFLRERSPSLNRSTYRTNSTLWGKIFNPFANDTSFIETFFG